MKEQQVKVFTAFSGYDSQCMALDRAGINYELVGWSEIDEYAIRAHNAIYPQWSDRNFGDICNIDWPACPDFDLFTYSFPCTDISSAGKQGGLEEGSGTRSSLLWECRKAIETKRPKFLLMENVKQLASRKFMPYFEKWLEFLSSQGYSNYWQIINAKHYVPQNRERVFCISILDAKTDFNFPPPPQCQYRLENILEPVVNERYYIRKPLELHFPDKTEDAKIYKIGNYHKSGHNASAIVSTKGISPTVMENHGTATAVFDPISQRCRKLTEREYFRLQDVSDEHIDLILRSVPSRSQQRKLAGNSIAVGCMEHLFSVLFHVDSGERKDL